MLALVNSAYMYCFIFIHNKCGNAAIEDTIRKYSRSFIPTTSCSLDRLCLHTICPHETWVWSLSLRDLWYENRCNILNIWYIFMLQKRKCRYWKCQEFGDDSSRKLKLWICRGCCMHEMFLLGSISDLQY